MNAMRAMLVVPLRQMSFTCNQWIPVKLSERRVIIKFLPPSSFSTLTCFVLLLFHAALLRTTIFCFFCLAATTSFCRNLVFWQDSWMPRDGKTRGELVPWPHLCILSQFVPKLIKPLRLCKDSKKDSTNPGLEGTLKMLKHDAKIMTPMS